MVQGTRSLTERSVGQQSRSTSSLVLVLSGRTRKRFGRRVSISRYPFQRQVEVPMFYRGIEVGLHRPDLLSASNIAVEVKAAKGITDTRFVFVRSYLRATGRDHGLILKFTKPTLEIKRVRTRTYE